LDWEKIFSEQMDHSLISLNDAHSAVKLTKDSDQVKDQIAKEFEQLEESFYSEYEQIINSVEYIYSPAFEENNYCKNRYDNIIPLEQTRVCLKNYSLIGLQTDYINANYIDNLSHSIERSYIACQAPLPRTFSAFWLMIWEHNATTIVMLTRFIENGQSKADQYWPNLVGQRAEIASLVITCQKINVINQHLIHRIFTLSSNRLSPDGETRTINHFQYLGWPDRGRPKSTKTIRYLIREINKPNIGPIVVHCSAGVGRSGTFIAINLYLQEIRFNQEISIQDVVRHLRKQRMFMVQTSEQYMFIHQAVKDELSYSCKKDQRPINRGRILSLSAPPVLCRSSFPRETVVSN
jgi:receptor-type tyrosine-protein phosphatase gamma